MARPIQLHFFPTPNTLKITMALEEMGLAYELVPVNIRAGGQFKPAFLAISPNNRVPAIVDPDGPDGAPISIFESGAILQYLSRKTGLFHGPDPRGVAAVDEWLFWQMAGLGPMQGQANHFRMVSRDQYPDQRQLAYGVHRYMQEARRLHGVMDKRLTGRDYLAGDFYSIADMACWGWINGMAYAGLTLDEFPQLRAWHARVGARDATKRALAVAEAFLKTL